MIQAREKIIVSFSGGQTSGFMCFFLLFNFGHLYEFIFLFANTGEEREETLVFIDKVDKAFGLKLVWLEAVVNPKMGKGIRHKVVNFETASRNGQPFEAFVSKSGIPNANKPQCSDRLKKLPIEDYKKTHGLRGLRHCIGIRNDEKHRKSKQGQQYNLIYPLCDWIEIDKQDINTFWENMPFSLGIEEHQGNCKTCWKKSNPKLWLLAIEEPESFLFMARMESQYQHVLPNKDGKPRFFFRKHRSAKDILKESQGMNPFILRKRIGYFKDADSGCSESCEAY